MPENPILAIPGVACCACCFIPLRFGLHCCPNMQLEVYWVYAPELEKGAFKGVQHYVNVWQKCFPGIFIRSFKTGDVIQEAVISVCKLEFDIAEYNDALFSTFTIEFPESLSSTILKQRVGYLAGIISTQI